MIRVLFLEDEPHLVETLPDVLKVRYSELQVVGLTDIAEALARLKEEKFDIVLIDISMPPIESMDVEEVEYGRLTGVKVIENIKRDQPGIPIVVLTVVKDTLIQNKLWAMGVVDIIHKPAEIAQIAETLLRVTR